MKFKIIKIPEPKRWDDLAYEYLGDGKNIKPIIQANPDIPIDLYVPAGSEIKIPIMEQNAAENENLPPWKR